MVACYLKKKKDAALLFFVKASACLEVALYNQYLVTFSQ